jgi:2-C-methyl-D-erythritol 4-phosphate cytidylyltransferase/2-C-methyl-D-erythritol 2,4-cyclodiphosphate synthase
MGKAPKTLAILLAAGQGARIGGLPKQYRLLGGMPVLRHSLLRLAQARDLIENVVVVIQPEHELLYQQAIEALPRDFLLPPVTGGVTRQGSVMNGLRALAKLQPQQVLIHDAARPFLTRELINAALSALTKAKGAIVACEVSDTLKRAANDFVSETIMRENLYAVQTPQAFDYATLFAAHIEANKQRRQDFTDDAALLEWQGHKVALVAGSNDNFKLTLDEDFARAEKFFAMVSRSALGYDVHAFAEGDHVMLGGVRVPHTRGVRAHSDGDVILHALTDAIFGLTGNGDIGRHFSPADSHWQNAPSRIFVAKALALLHKHGGKLNHCDVTLLAQEPKISAARDRIISSLATLLDLPPSSVGLKATTTEGLGFIGRREGIAAYVMASAQFRDLI